MIGDRKNKVAASVALTLLTAMTAQAQTNSSDNKNRQPVTNTRANLPGWMFTPFPVNGTKAEPPKINPFGLNGSTPMGVKPLTGPGAGYRRHHGGKTVIYQSGFPGYYPHGGAGTL
jgi:hypothetical protein